MTSCLLPLAITPFEKGSVDSGKNDAIGANSFI